MMLWEVRITATRTISRTRGNFKQLYARDLYACMPATVLRVSTLDRTTSRPRDAGRPTRAAQLRRRSAHFRAWDRRLLLAGWLTDFCQGRSSTFTFPLTQYCPTNPQNIAARTQKATHPDAARRNGLTRHHQRRRRERRCERIVGARRSQVRDVRHMYVHFTRPCPCL